MAISTDLVMLRQLVGNVVAGLTMHTHRELGEACERLGLPEPPGEGTKRERVDHSFAALPVLTCRKSHARIPDACAARNCRQAGDARRGAGRSPAAARIRRI